MYDRLYDAFEPGEVEVVVHADHPTLNRQVAAMLAAGERIDVLATHSKYAPSQSQWLRPLDDLLDDTAMVPLAPRAVELCRFDDAQLCLPRLIDVGPVAARRSRPPTPDTWDALVDSDVIFGFPGRNRLVRQPSSSSWPDTVAAVRPRSCGRRWPPPTPSTRSNVCVPLPRLISSMA